MKVVIALGGNALISEKQKGSYEELLKNIKRSMKNLSSLFSENKIIITHGNGREIGALVLQNELSRKKVPQMPLDVLGAETEGQLGYLIEQAVKNQIKKKVVTILTQVLVDKKDKAFENPTKFIGPFYSKRKAQSLIRKGYEIKKDSNRGYRRVVPSPIPKKIIEEKIITSLLKNNVIIVASGGGGIPVVKERKKLKGVEAVIDKDLASSLLARRINANLLLIITDIDKVYLNFGKKNKKPLLKLNVKECKKYIKKGEFPSGSMGPKIKAAIEFLDSRNKKVIITDIRNVRKALDGREGTLITKY